MRHAGKASLAMSVRRMPRRGAITLALLLSMAVVSVACGQKGALTLPGAAKDGAAPASAAASSASTR
jgi:predicted small lipoprotein YifL